MQCPICKKDLEIKNKKIGENEAGEAIYNEFAICRDCKKQWNLDKQREKKKKLAKEALAEKTVGADKAAEKPRKKRPAAEGERTSAERPAQPKKKKKHPVSPENAEKRTASSANPEVPAHPKKKRPNPAAEGERPVRKPRPKTEGSSEEQPSRPHPKKRPATSDRPLLKYAEGQEESREKVRPRPKKKRPEEAKPIHAIDNSSTRIISDEEDELKITAPDLSTPEGEKEQTYSNIPPKHVREKREQEMRENYQNMLDEEDDDDERHFPVVLVVILIFLIIAAAAFAGYWFFLK